MSNSTAKIRTSSLKVLVERVYFYVEIVYRDRSLDCDYFITAFMINNAEAVYIK